MSSTTALQDFVREQKKPRNGAASGMGMGNLGAGFDSLRSKVRMMMVMMMMMTMALLRWRRPLPARGSRAGSPAAPPRPTTPKSPSSKVPPASLMEDGEGEGWLRLGAEKEGELGRAVG